MIPAYVAFLGLSVWLLWRTGRRRGDIRPFWLALAGAIFAITATWLALSGVAPALGWWSYLGVAVIVGASLWSFAIERRPRDCLDEMILEECWRERRGSPARRTAIAALGVALAAVSLYGVYASVNAFVPGG